MVSGRSEGVVRACIKIWDLRMPCQEQFDVKQVSDLGAYAMDESSVDSNGTLANM